MTSILLDALLALLALAVFVLLGLRLRELELRQRQDREQLRRLQREAGAPHGVDDAPAPDAPAAASRTTDTVLTPATDPADGIDYDAIRGDLERVPQGRIGLLILQLHQEAPGLATRFVDPEARQQFRQDFGPALFARLRRLVEAIESDQLTAWADNDLLELLNQLARHLSVAAQQAHRGQGDAELGRRLRQLLYEDFGQLCRQQRWYTLDPVVPFETRFDPDRHHALGGRDLDGAAGLVVDLKVVGRQFADSGRAAQRAQVIVGR